MLRLFLFLGIVTTALASVTLEALDSAAQSFSTAIDQQWAIAQSEPTPATLSEKHPLLRVRKDFLLHRLAGGDARARQHRDGP